MGVGALVGALVGCLVAVLLVDEDGVSVELLSGAGLDSAVDPPEVEVRTGVSEPD